MLENNNTGEKEIEGQAVFEETNEWGGETGAGNPWQLKFVRFWPQGF